MKAALIGRKIGMTQVYDADGAAIPVTVVRAGPCTVTQVKHVDTDGYEAVQLGFEDAKIHRATRPIIGHCAKAGTGPKRVFREIRLDAPADDVKPGDVITVECFRQANVQFVDVIGLSKGKGFAGVMKRHGFGGQPASHGTERKHRSPGSIGGHGTNVGAGGRLYKGKRMAGHMGHRRCTVKNQRLVHVDPENHLLLIEGGIPGPPGGVVIVRQAKTKAPAPQEA